MTKHIELQIAANAGNFMWFRDLSADRPDANGSFFDKGHPVANASLNYDVELLPDHVWILHIDIGLHVRPIAEIKVRVSFQTVYDGSMELILGLEVMDEVVSIALNNCLRAFNEQCEAHGIAYRHQKIDMEIGGALQYIRDHYATEMKALENTWFRSSFSSFTPGNNTRLLCKVPFMIMDLVFLSDGEFDHRHNAPILFKHVPEPFYFTTKMRCRTIDTGNVVLSGAHTVYYLICLDCALQLLVGDHEDRFEMLVRDGLNPEMRRSFISWGTKYFETWHENLKKTGSNITNFDRRPDWNSVIR